MEENNPLSTPPVPQPPVSPSNPISSPPSTNRLIWVLGTLMLFPLLGLILMWLFMKDWPKKAKMTVTLMYVGLILIVVGLQMYLTFLFVSTDPFQKLKDAEALNEKNMSMISPSPTSSPTTNWKTYINKDYGFSFQYLQDWKVKENSDGVSIEKEQYFPGPKSGMWKGQVLTAKTTINSTKIQTGITLEKLFETYYEKYSKDLYELTKQSIKKVKVAGVNGLEVKTPGASGYLSEETLFIYNGHAYRIGLDGMEAVDDSRKNYNQILSTFTFTNPTQNTAAPTATEGKFCGGIAGNLPENQCPTGYECQLDGNYPDAGGTCIKQ